MVPLDHRPEKWDDLQSDQVDQPAQDPISSTVTSAFAGADKFRRRLITTRQNPPIRTRVLIVQHAEKQPGPGDQGLTANGRHQGAAAVATLVDLEISAIYSSPLRRARETAELIGERLGLAVTTDPRLVERANWAGGDQSFEQFLAEWRRAGAERDFQPSAGDSSRAAGERLRSAVAEIAERHPDGTVVLVSHGGVTVDMARSLVGDEGVEGLAPGLMEEGVSPCAVTELSVQAREVVLVGIGQVGWRPVGWLPGPDPDALRSALEVLDPSFSGRSLRIAPWVAEHPRWFKASAVLDDAYLVKFAWSQPAAQRVTHEAAVLDVLHRVAPHLPVPEVVAASAYPALLVTWLVPGRPLSLEEAGVLDTGSRRELAGDLARFLAELHAPEVAEAVRHAGIRTEHPRPQAETRALRSRFPRWIEGDQVRLLNHCCDYADTVLAGSGVAEVLLHGDLHGHNLVLVPGAPRLRLVADLETAAYGDAAFDFRYLPGQVASNPVFFTDVAERYQAISGRTVDVDRIIAWHIRTVLGDALWRSEAGVPLPDGRTPPQWMEDLRGRLATLGRRMAPAFRSIVDE